MRCLGEPIPLPKPLRQPPAWEDLALWYAFDELAGTRVRDLSPRGNHGTLTNGPLWVPTPEGPGVQFTAASAQYVDVANPTGIPIGDEPYTLVVRFKAGFGAGTKYGFVGYGNFGTNLQVNAFRTSEDWLANYWWGNDLFLYAGWVPTSYHVAACTYDGTTRRIYLDGAEKGSDTPAIAHAVPNANNLKIGVASSGDAEYMQGGISAALIYKRALTAVQVKELKEYLL